MGGTCLRHSRASNKARAGGEGGNEALPSFGTPPNLARRAARAHGPVCCTLTVFWKSESTRTDGLVSADSCLQPDTPPPCQPSQHSPCHPSQHSDRILLLFDAYKLDLSDEFKEVVKLIQGYDKKVRVVLNKADGVSPQVQAPPPPASAPRRPNVAHPPSRHPRPTVVPHRAAILPACALDADPAEKARLRPPWPHAPRPMPPCRARRT